MNHTVTINLLDFYSTQQLAIGKPWGGVASAAPAGFKVEGVLNAPRLQSDALGSSTLVNDDPFSRSIAGEFGDVIAVGLIPAFRREGMTGFEGSIQYCVIGRSDSGGARLIRLRKWDAEYFGGRLSKNQPRIATFLRPIRDPQDLIENEDDRRWAIPKSQTLPAQGSEKVVVDRWPVGAPASLVQTQFDYTKNDPDTVLRYLLFATKEYLKNLYFDVDDVRLVNKVDLRDAADAMTVRLEKIIDSWGGGDSNFEFQFCLDLKKISRQIYAWPTFAWT